MSDALQDVLQRIERLPAEDRRLLDDYLAEQAEAEWRAEAAQARKVARQQGIDQAAIDRAVERARYGS